ncbi:unnamed protein product [Musa acuminata var. zebrina]
MDMQFLKSNLGGNWTDPTVWDAESAVIVKCSTHLTRKSTSSSTIAPKTPHDFFLESSINPCSHASSSSSHHPELKMDYDFNKISPEKEVSVEFVRESLMAISQSLPDVIHAPNGFPVKTPVAADAVGDQNVGSGAEEYRSKLISISYMQSPDVKLSPSLAENLGV